MTPLRLIALALLAVLISIPSCGEKGSADGDPHPLTGALKGRSFVMVVADSLDAQHLSAYGYPRETSPFLAEMAQRGVRAERTLSQTSWTLSSVASLFTGLVQERHGVLTAEQQLSPDGPRVLAEMFRDAGYRTVGIVENAVAGPQSKIDRGFDEYRYLRPNPGDVDPLRKESGRAEKLFAQASVELDRALGEGSEKPVFLYLHLLPPHMPYTPPEPYASMFREVVGSEITGSIENVARIQARGLSRDHPDLLRLIETYDAHIAYADVRLRQLVESRLDDVCVLFTSDHGEAFMQHGATGHNAFCYEEMVRVPWILAGPAPLPRNVTVGGVTSLLDTLPTLAQLFDLELPGSRVDGLSLVEAFDGTAAAAGLDDRELYLSSRYPPQGKGAQFALVEGAWKLVTRRRGALPVLFDLDADPEEQRDLSEEHPERAERMARRVGEIRTRLREEAGEALSSPLGATMIRDMEALGYAGSSFQDLVPAKGDGK